MAQPKEKTPDSTIRNLFLRVSSTNVSTSGVVNYNIDDIKSRVTDLADRYTDTQFALIAHDKDTNPDGAVALHFHIFMKFAKPVKFKYIKDIFPFGSIQSSRSSNACVQYLIHKNNPEKHQYDKSEIITNITADKLEAFFMNDKKVSSLKEEEELNEILDQIDNGTIRQFNFSDYIDVRMYSKHKTKIDNAFAYREKKITKDKNRNLDVWFVTGVSGSGKTTIAKKFAEQDGIGVCISSSSNDPLQDYGGEDTLILDDLRDTDFKFSDLLKILDNHTKSSIKSRFRNKSFIGKRIIITSYVSIEDWYAKVPDDAKIQLYRRISTFIEVTTNEIKMFAMNKFGDRQLKETMSNPVTLLKAQVIQETNLHQVALSFASSFTALTLEQQDELIKSIAPYIEPEVELPF